MIVDGKQIAAEILARTKERATALPRPPRVVAFYASETPAMRSYLVIKTKRAADAGCVFETRTLHNSDRPADIVAYARDADALIMQLPLLAHFDTQTMLDSIPIEKDADVLSTAARERFEKGEKNALLPPVVAAIQEIFVQNNVSPKGQRAVVIGEGWLVGQPAAIWLKQQGAEVEVLNSKTGDITSKLIDADIIVSGAGVPGLIKPEMLKEGVVLIDAATSESNGLIAGDADPSCAAKCSLFTPVPGGVGPIAVACLFANAVTLAERAK
jgi:methylenetetrahydrofolate dehydrogenase (NADP+)/methenyltetrahydrofolate cyclohydrolase